MASVWLIASLACFFLVSTAFADTCQNPQVKTNSYTTTDGTIVRNIGFIAEFTVSCSNNVKNLNLFAEINGLALPVTKSIDENKYQVSWTSDPKDVKSYYHTVKVFDEQGYSIFRRAQRSGEDSGSLEPLFTVDIYHSGTYSGPWFQSEVLATLAVIGVWYYGYHVKSKLMA